MMVKWNWRKSRIIFPRENERLVAILLLYPELAVPLAVQNYLSSVFQLSQFFSGNRRFVGARAFIFGNTVNVALENLTNL